MSLRVLRCFPRSLRGSLLLLTTVTVLPALLLTGYVVFQAYDYERRAVEARLLETSRALSLVVDRQLGQAEAVLRTLAASPALERRDYAAFHEQATAALLDESSGIALVGADNRLLMSTAVPLETVLPVTEPPPELEEVLSRRRIFVSNLLPDLFKEGWVLLVALRMGPPGDAAPRLVMTLPPTSLHSILADQQIPASWNIAIVDRNGIVIARSREPEGFVGGPATERARAAISAADEGVFRSRALDGIDSVGAFARVPGSGWTVILSAPLEETTAPADRLLMTAGTAAFLASALGVAVALAIRRRIVRAMAKLTADARSVGHGEIPPYADTGIADTQLVADTLRASARRLKEGEKALIGLNETLESRVQEATERLVASSKLEAIGRLTGGVAHDFNNILAAIRINLDMVLRRFPAPKSLEFAKAARDSSERGAKLVAQLLAFARQQRLTPEPVDVNGVAAGMVDMLRTTLTTVELGVELTPDLPPALTDRTQLEMIIMNLTINARDAMPDGGTITLRTSQTTVETRGAEPEAPMPGDYVVLTVEDSGTGMDAELQRKVFEPFFTTKKVGEGSGLGLSQVLGIVKQLGGGIQIDSSPGRGTRVHVYLPVATGCAAAGEADASIATAQCFHGVRVLLVDDDSAVRGPAAALLEDMGCRVETAEGGEAALARLSEGYSPDLVLLDYAMPGMNGIELATRLDQLPATPAIVLMTGFADAVRVTGRWRGPILQKPFSQEALADALAAALPAR